MSFITDMIVQQIGTSGAKMVADKFGIPQNVAQMAISAALPMLIGGLGRNASNPSGAQSLAGALERDHTGGILNNVPRALESQAETQDGMAILGHILGNKKQNASQALGQTAGLEPSQSEELMAMLAPIVLGQLGKTKQEQNLDASGLADLLGKEKEVADEQLGGMSRLLDMDGDGDISDDMLKLGSSLLGGLFK